MAAAAPANAGATTGSAARARVVATVHVPGGAAVVADDPVARRLFVGNVNDDRVTAISTSEDRVLGISHAGCCGQYGLAVDPLSHKVYAAGIDDNLFVLDGRTGHRLADVDVSRGGLGAPFAVAVDPLSRLAYVTSAYDDVVTVIDGRTNAVRRTFSVPDGAVALAVDPLAHRIYFVGGTVLDVVDSRTAAVVGSLDLGKNLGSVAVDPIRRTVYVTSTDDSTLTVVNARSLHAVATVSVGPAVGTTLLTVADDPATGQVLVASYSGRDVVVVDGGTNRVVQRLPIGAHAVGLAVDPFAGRAYVVSGGSSVVVVKERS